MKRRGSILAAAVARVALSCDESQVWHEVHPYLARMLHQKRATPLDETSAFADGKVMQLPPEGAVPRGPVEPAYVRDGAYVERIPIPVTRALLERGRSRFENTCAACHGELGDGQSVVAEKMESRKPRSLQDDAVRAYPPGRTYEIVRDGYGLMPSYAAILQDPDDRWAVVGYVKALQLSQHAPVAGLPPDLQERLARSTR
jgi:mono/diheme cytochrome c family protein